MRLGSERRQLHTFCETLIWKTSVTHLLCDLDLKDVSYTPFVRVGSGRRQLHTFVILGSGRRQLHTFCETWILKTSVSRPFRDLDLEDVSYTPFVRLGS